MESSISLLLLLVVTGLLTVAALIPPGYILKVKPQCGSNQQNPEDAHVMIVTDLNAEPRAECADGSVNFNNTDTVHFYLPIVYPPNKGPCVTHGEFKRVRLGRPVTSLNIKEIADGVYTIKVFIAWGEAGSLIRTNEEQYSVTCTFEDKGDDETANRTVVDGLVAAKAIQVYRSESSISMSLVVTDVLGHTLDSRAIPMGRKIRLKGTADSDLNGLHAVGCDAIGKNNNNRYAIIRAGCGDGIIFKKTVGFTTSENVTWSPFFEAFTLPGNTEISFECNFTSCAVPCNGNTCRNKKRRKRQMDENEVEYYILMQTEPIEITPENSDEQEAVVIMKSHPALTENDAQMQYSDQTVWVAIAFITMLAITSIFLSVCALVNKDRSGHSDEKFKL